MGTIQYQYVNMNCPNCSNRLRRGTRRFGPKEVHCAHCDATVNTGLGEWAELSTGKKVLQAVGELLWPSWLGLVGCNGIVMGLITHTALFAFAAMPLMMVGLAFGLESGLGTTISLLAWLTYPVLLIVRLVHIVRESNAYTRSGVLPTWGKARRKAS